MSSAPISRRAFLGRSGMALGAVALDLLRGREAKAAQGDRASLPHFAAKAKRVVFLTQSGGPSQLELFDPKPGLVDFAGTALPESVRDGQRVTGMTAGKPQLVLPAASRFRPRGECGMELSDWIPHLAGIADDLCLVRSMTTDEINHAPAMTKFLTGNQLPGRPSLGSWISYGLGSENRDLPDYVALLSKLKRGSDQPLYDHYWGSGFLPSTHQGVKLRAAAEACGVFVLVLGNLGSHHTAIAASVFRGFAIADDIAPFVVINSSDARPARAFTLMHELAHIWLGATGVSGDVSTKAPVSDHAKVERFCNDVAGEFLLPDLHFKQATPSFNASDVNAAEAAIDLIASRWSVSEPMVAYRLHRRNELSAGAYETLRGHYHARWQAKLKRDKEKRAPDATGPSRHVLQQFNLGSALVDIIHRTVRGNQLTHTRAAALLGSKPGAVEPFLRQFEAKRGSFRSSAGGRG